ncbi:hypothetical protein FO440_23305 [Mucilaginibacter corticis]|uniref:Uncharacterized protein n=1 Tax=Mucilaginibacter corticis TaxID=2597670 RepID=A0A556M990_9SPHI|nr:hypothetical protein [Mucilaginibacter corticis]TSJ36431.1 hypothetical protein FO440_23305 [Mucilaginibacter corticis]
MVLISDELFADLRNQRCKIHKKQPHIELVDNKLELDCCCDAFKLFCYKEVIAILNEQKSHLLPPNLIN